MALVKCPSCGSEVSSAAAACPKCGHPMKAKNPGCISILAAIIGLVFLAALLRSCFPGQSSTPAPSPISSPSPPPDPAAQAKTRAEWLAKIKDPATAPAVAYSTAFALERNYPDSPEGKEAAALLPKLKAAADQSVAEKATAGKWEYSQPTDDLTGKPYKLAMLTSENTIDLDFPYQGQQNAYLALREHPKYGKDVIIRVLKGQVMCSSYSCPVQVVFDDEKPVTFEGEEPDDNSTETVFLKQYSRFQSKLKTAKTVRIGLTFYQNGTKVMVFDTQGFDPKKM